jgi:hypothetical protein
MNGIEIRQLNAEDAAEYQAVFLGALLSAPIAFAAGYGEESARSSDKIAERFRREVIFRSICGRTPVCNRNILAANLPKADSGLGGRIYERLRSLGFEGPI